MKIKERGAASKDELAKFMLEAAKKILENGTISIGENAIDLPETFEMELEYKEKKDRTRFAIEFVWNTSGGAKNYINGGLASVTPIKLSTVPDNFKSIKKEMEKVLTA